MSHDDFLTCGSPGAQKHLDRLLIDDNFHKSPCFSLYHSLEGPIFAPIKRNDRKFHYCGMNWERLTSRKGRHDGLLRFLDSKGIIDIYGPDKFQGVRPWAGYKCYQGEVPFDGESIVGTISKSGIALVLSSEAHSRAGMMSNRLFEAMAAGVPIVCDGNPKAREIIGENGYYIDPQNYKEVQDVANYINRNPEEAYSKAVNCQKIFLDNFRTSLFLDKIYQGFLARKKALEITVDGEDDITAIFVGGYSNEETEKNLKPIEDQIKHNLSKKDFAYILVPEGFECGGLKLSCECKCEFCFVKIDDKNNRCIGETVSRILKSVKTKYFALVNTNEYALKDHFRALMKTLEIEGGDVAISDVIVKNVDSLGVSYRARQTISVMATDRNIYLSGAFVFKTGKIDEGILSILKGLDISLALLFLLGDIAIVQSKKFSLVVDHFDAKSPRDVNRLLDLRRKDVLGVLSLPEPVYADENNNFVYKIRNRILFLKKYRFLWQILRNIGRRFV